MKSNKSNKQVKVLKKELTELREMLKDNEFTNGRDVKLSNLKNRNGFINPNGTRKDIFLDHTAITRNN